MLISRIIAHAEETGTAAAVVDAAGEHLDYAALAMRVGAASQTIANRYGRGRCLLLRPEATLDSMVTLLAVIASGNTAVPVAATTRGEQLAWILARCEGEELAPEVLSEKSTDSPLVDLAEPGIPPIVMFTSGTTGHPKGVICTGGNIAHSCAAIADYLDYHHANSAAVVLPLHYSYSLISQVLAQLYVGGSAHLFGTLRNPLKVARAVNERDITVFSGVPSTFAALKMFHGMQPLSMPGVKVLCSAGAPFDLEMHPLLREIFPAARIFNNYGATEATPRISWVADDEPEFFQGSCGRPIDALEVQAIDPETGEVRADGQPGIIAIRGPNVTPGYLNDPDRTAAAFTADGFFLTNDIGSIRKGQIHVQGRADDIFDVGGEKVAPREIEQALMAVPGVEGSAVVGLRDELRGHVPVAFLKVRASLSKAEINAALAKLIAPGKIPVRYYRVESFPETDNGKLKRRELHANEAEYTQHEIS